MSSTNNANVICLNADCFDHILSYLNAKDVINVARSCRAFYNLFKEAIDARSEVLIPNDYIVLRNIKQLNKTAIKVARFIIDVQPSEKNYQLLTTVIPDNNFKSIILKFSRIQFFKKTPCDDLINLLGLFHRIDVSSKINPDQLYILEQAKSVRFYNRIYVNDNINLLNFSSLKNLHTINLSYTDIISLNGLEHVKYFTAMWCDNLVDLNGARNAYSANFSNCCNIIDVSALGNVHDLDLSGCPITDVSMLGRVHTLNISCTQVSDVSALGNVHTLDISCTPVTDISALTNVQDLNIAYCGQYC